MLIKFTVYCNLPHNIGCHLARGCPQVFYPRRCKRLATYHFDQSDQSLHRLLHMKRFLLLCMAQVQMRPVLILQIGLELVVRK